ncbi:MAG: hypothetical protein ACLFQV_08955 [Vulcanimicrobiota bacterium]
MLTYDGKDDTPVFDGLDMVEDVLEEMDIIQKRAIEIAEAEKARKKQNT